MAVTVDEFVPGMNERPYWTLSSDKFKAKYMIKPTRDGFVFYEIVVDKGTLAPALHGMFSTSGRAVETFTQWEALQKATPAKKRSDNVAARKAQKEETANA